ncbi:F0F1 ATP synthase subunit beta, partial [Candidatus Uhrbacteria bacterium]|nr:F0F1 ATP synthase subunit beta [Candidatus Uhrbacteria bacterium]
MQKGTITQVIGPVVDVRFSGEMPAILNALTLEHAGRTLVLEAQQHLGAGVVRTIAMSSTDGLARGTEVVDTGKPISVPVGRETLGRMFSVIGEAIDGKSDLKAKKYFPIHRPAPSFDEQSSSTEVFETGIK